MALLFEPVKFIRSAAEYSNVSPNSDEPEIDSENQRLLDEEREKIVPLNGEEAHSFYVSLFSAENSSESIISTVTPSSTVESEKYSIETASTSKKSIVLTKSISTTTEKARISKLTAKSKKKLKKTKPEPPIDILRNRFLKSAAEGNLTDVQRIFDKNPSILNSVDEFGWSALMCASYEGHFPVVEFLLRRDADFRLLNRKNRSAANLARRRGHREVYELLSKAENGESFDDRLISDGNMEIREEFCEICGIRFRDPNHETSTSHLLKLSSSTGSDDVQRPNYSISESNRGFQLMLKQDWDQRGLGRDGQGRWYPVKTILKRDRKGLGSRDGPKPRVTHFGPNDVTAIEKAREADRLMRMRALNLDKKELAKKEAKEREWIKKFRREFH